MKKSRLRKIAEEADLSVHLLLNDPMSLVDTKDKVTKKTYSPSINREWDFEKPIDNPEWALKDSNW